MTNKKQTSRKGERQTMQHAEDLLAEKDRDYVQGFLDATLFLNGHAQDIMDTVPESKRFGALVSALETVYSLALERHEEQIKQRFGILLEIGKENENHE
jgi:hypothetical protein